MAHTDTNADDMRDLLMVVRRALMSIVAWIDKRYSLGPHKPQRDE